MQITVRFYGSLRDKLPEEKHGKTTLDLAQNTTVQDVLDMFEIDDYVLVAVNNQHDSNSETLLNANDTLMIFEPASGG